MGPVGPLSIQALVGQRYWQSQGTRIVLRRVSAVSSLLGQRLRLLPKKTSPLAVATHPAGIELQSALEG